MTNVTSKIEDLLPHYHRLFLVEKLDPELHGSTDKDLNEKKHAKAAEMAKAAQAAKPTSKRDRFWQLGTS